MARRPEVDRRQGDFFGVPALPTATPEPRPASKQKPDQDIQCRSPPSDSKAALLSDSIDALAARLSRIELNELAAALPDDALAHLVIATARQIRRRLTRIGRRSGKGQNSALERSVRQLMVELGRQDEDDQDCWVE